MVILFTTGALFAQDDYPVENRDYELTIENSGGITSFYLRNLSSGKLLFFNFRINIPQDEKDIVQNLPESIVILEPHRNALIFRAKSAIEPGMIRWESHFMVHSIGFSKYPENHKHYVFYWETSGEGDLLRYSYFMQNISGKRLRFSNFTSDGAEASYSKKLPECAFILEPKAEARLCELTVSKGSNAPLLSWNHHFATFQPAGGDFCNVLTRILEASKDKGFETLPYPGNETGDIKLSGFHNLRITGQDGRATLAADSETISTAKETKALYIKVKNQIDQCLPDLLTQEETKNKQDKTISVTFEGVIDSRVFRLSLGMVAEDAGADRYKLLLTVMEAG